MKEIILKNRIKDNLLDCRVDDIIWQDIYVTIKIDINSSITNLEKDKIKYYLVDNRHRAVAAFKVNHIKNDKYELYLNVTNPGNNRMLEEGRFKIFATYGRSIIAVAKTCVNETRKASSWSRELTYGRGSYFVKFYCKEAGGDIIVHSFNKSCMEDNSMTNSFVKKYGKKFLEAYYDLHNKKKRKTGKKIVLFMTEQSESIRGNLKAISSKMIERKMNRDYIMEYSARSVISKKYDFKSWLAFIKKLAYADVIFTDDHVPILDWLKINDKTTDLVQVWHAGAGYKATGYSRWTHEEGPDPFSCHRQYKYVTEPSNKVAEFHSEAFALNRENFLVTGMPRMDEYIDPNHRSIKVSEIRERIKGLGNKKVILFAPTFRGSSKKEAYYPFEKIDQRALYELCGDEFLVLFKFHPWISEKIAIDDSFKDKLLDLSDYPNINDLYYITDLYISDYSSGIFEYSLMNKPALFYAFDKDIYAKERGFHRDYDLSVPGKICHDFSEVLTAIKNKDFEFHKMKDYIDEHFDYVDSKASDRVIDYFVLDRKPKVFLEGLKAKKRENNLLESLAFDF